MKQALFLFTLITFTATLTHADNRSLLAKATTNAMIALNRTTLPVVLIVETRLTQQEEASLDKTPQAVGAPRQERLARRKAICAAKAKQVLLRGKLADRRFKMSDETDYLSCSHKVQMSRTAALEVSELQVVTKIDVPVAIQRD